MHLEQRSKIERTRRRQAGRSNSSGSPWLSTERSEHASSYTPNHQTSNTEMRLVMTAGCQVLGALNTYRSLCFNGQILEIVLTWYARAHTGSINLKETIFLTSDMGDPVEHKWRDPPRKRDSQTRLDTFVRAQPPLIHVHTPRGCPKPVHIRTHLQILYSISQQGS